MPQTKHDEQRNDQTLSEYKMRGGKELSSFNVGYIHCYNRPTDTPTNKSETD